MCVEFSKNGGKDPTIHITSCSYIAFMAVKYDIKKNENKGPLKKKMQGVTNIQRNLMQDK